MTRKYYPGFDWVKLFAATLFALYHVVHLPLFDDVMSPQVFSFLGGLVPVFFMISGHLMYSSLMKKNKPLRHVCGYVLKYGLFYFVLCLIGNFSSHWQSYVETGNFHLYAFCVKMVTMFFRSPPMTQLWFVPPLIFGILINSFVFIKQKEKLFFWILLPSTFLIIGFEIYGLQFMHLPVVQLIKTANDFRLITYFLSRTIQGIFFIYIGMLVAKYPEQSESIKLTKLLPIVIIVTIIDVFLVYSYGSADINDLKMNATMTVWAVVIFFLLMRLKNNWIQKHHSFVTYYTVLTFFLHILQNMILQYIFASDLLRFCCIMLMNVSLSLFLSQQKKKKELKNGF